ncbi:MAG: NFACT RNA binding domain-containing protein [Polyangiaceae bacterium]
MNESIQPKTRALDAIAALRRELDRAVNRLDKRATAVRADLKKIEDAEQIGMRASWLIAAAAKAKRGAKDLQVSDWTSGEEVVVTVPLDPAKTAREQVEAMFVKAKRLRSGRPVAEKRLFEAIAIAGRLREIRAAADAIDLDASDLHDAEDRVETLHAEARATAPREIRTQVPSAKKPQQARSLCYREFVGSANVKILVGRGASQNDELTFQVARPFHAWLHARGDAGAHVVVLVKKGGELTAEQLVDAATLAAHFSKARGESIVDVAYTYRRYVRKPRKSPPGAVMVDKEKVVTLRLEPERLAKLLATESAS